MASSSVPETSASEPSATAEVPAESEEPSAKRFCHSSEEDRQKLIDHAVPQKTAVANAFWKRTLDDYCCSCPDIKKAIDFKTVEAESLASILERFFVDARRKDGQPYKKNSLKAVRGAVQRLLVAENRKINVFTDREFLKSRKVLDGVLKERKRSGQEELVQHAQAISDEDWDKVALYFKDIESSTDPVLLARYVEFDTHCTCVWLCFIEFRIYCH